MSKHLEQDNMMKTGYQVTANYSLNSFKSFTGIQRSKLTVDLACVLDNYMHTSYDNVIHFGSAITQ